LRNSQEPFLEILSEASLFYFVYPGKSSWDRADFSDNEKLIVKKPRG